MNLKSRRPATGPGLLARHRRARCNFARERSDWNEQNWSRICSLDESRCIHPMVVKGCGDELTKGMCRAYSAEKAMAKVPLWSRRAISLESSHGTLRVPKEFPYIQHVYRKHFTRLCNSICTLYRERFYTHA